MECQSGSSGFVSVQLGSLVFPGTAQWCYHTGPKAALCQPVLEVACLPRPGSESGNWNQIHSAVPTTLPQRDSLIYRHDVLAGVSDASGRSCRVMRMERTIWEDVQLQVGGLGHMTGQWG